uniref:Uncharacterized protein n=1 Tax=Romanomermis culicivorax TaxID=13658 RepID=A0A915JZW0_ROMCU
MRQRQALQTFDELVNKAHNSRGVYFLMSWSALGLAFFAFLFIYKDPVTGDSIIVKPKDARKFSLGLPQNFEVQTFDADGHIVKKIVNPAAIDDD